jgi:hypothetical protein
MVIGVLSNLNAQLNLPSRIHDGGKYGQADKNPGFEKDRGFLLPIEKLRRFYTGPYNHSWGKDKESFR